MDTNETNKVKKYRINKQFGNDIRGAIKIARAAVLIYGNAVECAEINYTLNNMCIGIGSGTGNKYLSEKVCAFKREYKKALAKLDPARAARATESYRRSQLSPESRRLEDLTAQVTRLNVQLAERGLVDSEA